MPKLDLLKNCAAVQMERNPISGFYSVQLRTPAGALHDRVSCDTYRQAIEYRRAFRKIARNL